MHYQILGPVRVFDEHTESQLNAEKIRTLLAVLLIRREQILTKEQLISELWSDRAPRRACATLHVYISQLRKFLNRTANATSTITTFASGYLFSLGNDSLDLTEFNNRIDRGRDFLHMNSATDADRELTAALELCQGPVLGDLRADGPIICGFIAWAEEAELEARNLWIDAQFSQENYGQLISSLSQLISEHPLRESYHHQLMLALHRSSRQHDAINIYQKFSANLGRELGISPSAALKSLYQSIIVGDAADDERTCALSR
ncbi:AfsR/SARP family transcriptional regulator [Nocardia sp. NPDC055321]